MSMEKQILNRPDPEALLKKINKETRGKLTVFLGAMAGVGKTFTMLKSAHEKHKEGRNIVIGWVETHKRIETEKMVEGLPKVAPAAISYRDKQIPEMDIDAILELKPEIVIVDELAHTNAPGSRHVRRYQDVEELLEAGIHVYTAVNIQHIESLNDIVAQITGVIVRETVPDSVLEEADTVQLIDIAPEDLIQRLRDGKIYMPEQAERALKKFFREGNISALRELSLRFTAQRVDKDLAEYMREHHIAGPWPAAGRVMVCISGSPFSAQLIRAANRLATGLRSELLAVHIEAAKMRFPIGDKERDRIAKNMRLAEDLGARTLTVVGEDFIDEILDIARKQNVTAIVVGKTKHKSLLEFIRGSVVDNIIRQSGDVNVYVIQGAKESETEAAVKTKRVIPLDPVNYFYLSLLMVAAVTGLAYLLKEQLEMVNIALLYIIPVLLSAFWWGRWPSYLSAITGVLAFDFLFIEPLLTFTVSDIRYLWSFVIFLLLSALIGGRTDELKKETRQARQQEKSTRAVYEFSRDIAAVIDTESIARSLVKQAGETIERKIVVILPSAQQKLEEGIKFDPTLEPENQMIKAELNRAEAGVVAWVYKNKQSAGRSTDTLPGGKYLYVPLCSQDNVFGVFGICIAEQKLTPSERRLIDAWVRLAAVAMERVSLAEQARHTDMLIEADKLRSALFNSISHELKTPLSAIIGSVSTLLEADDLYSKADRRELLGNVKDSSLRMERLIGNLLDTARIESGMMNIKSDWCDIEDIIGTTLRRMGDAIGSSQIAVELPSQLPLIKADCVLIEQVLVNLIDNSIKYSEGDEKITIQACKQPTQLEVSVIDSGNGIPPEDLVRIFDKFYRVKQPKKVSGTGLGLSICKGIIEAHKGRIYAQNRIDGKTVISFTLPL